jgi:hypothetical protein
MRQTGFGPSGLEARSLEHKIGQVFSCLHAWKPWFINSAYLALSSLPLTLVVTMCVSQIPNSP